MALASTALASRPTPTLRTAAAPRALLVRCRVARPTAVLDRPAAAEPSSSADASPTQSGDRPPRRRRAPRRRSSPPPPPRSAAAAASDDDEETSDDNDQEQQNRQEGPTFTPVESAASLILRGLRQPALVAEGDEGSEGQGDNEGSANNDPPTVPLAVEGTQGLAVAVLALSRAQHALRTERGLELVIGSPSTRRGRGPKGNTSLRARLRASPAQAPTDRPVRRVDVVPGTSRNSVVAAAVDALRAAHPAPVDLIARGPRAASNALAALGLVRATLLSGAASFTPAAPPPWVVKRGGGGGGREDDDDSGSAEAPAATARRPPAFAPLDVSAVLDALPPARPAAAALAAGDAAQLPPHELVVRLRLTTGPPPPPREDRDRDRGERPTGERRRRTVAAAAADAAPAAADGGEVAAAGANGDDKDTTSRRPRRSRSATRREKASAVAELRAAAATSGNDGAETASLRRELAELGERVRDLAKMNAVVLDLLEKEKRRGA